MRVVVWPVLLGGCPCTACVLGGGWGQAEEAEEDEVDRMGDKKGGGRRRRETLSDSQKSLFVVEFQAKLERAVLDDVEANLKGKPAIHKLRALPELTETLRKSVWPTALGACCTGGLQHGGPITLVAYPGRTAPWKIRRGSAVVDPGHGFALEVAATN